ncbi:hypothetical protein GEMRC1_004035 [Eukaryota sp. GEM-RC1]
MTLNCITGSETGWIHSYISGSTSPSKIQPDPLKSAQPLMKGISSLSFIHSDEGVYTEFDRPFLSTSCDGCVSIISPLLVQTEQFFVPTTSPLIAAHGSYSPLSDTYEVVSFSGDGSIFKGELFITQLPVDLQGAVPILPGLQPLPRATISQQSSSYSIAFGASAPTLAKLDSSDSSVSTAWSGVFLYDPETSRSPVSVLLNKTSSSRVNCISSIGNSLLSGDANGTVNVWDLRKTDQPVNRLKGAVGSVKDIAVVGDSVMAVDLDQRLTIWNDLKDRKPVSVFVHDRLCKVLGYPHLLAEKKDGEPNIKKRRN